MLPHEFMDRNSSYSANSSSKSEDTLAFKCNPFKFNLELLLGLFFRPLIRKLLAILGLKSKVLCFSAKPRLPWIFLTLTKVPMLLSTRSWSKWGQKLSEVTNVLLISKNFALTFNKGFWRWTDVCLIGHNWVDRKELVNIDYGRVVSKRNHVTKSQYLIGQVRFSVSPTICVAMLFWNQ